MNLCVSATMKNGGDSRTNQKVNYTFVLGANGSSTAMVAGMEYLRNDVSDGSISYTYDDGGNIRTITENGKTFTYSYDGLNQLVHEDNERDGKSYTYTYDNGGNITAKSEYAYTTADLGTPVAAVNYGYGDADWKDLMTNYNGQTITYDAIGNPLTYRDGMTMTWQRGHQLASLHKGSTAVNYVYGEDGLRTKKTVNGAATNYHWNDLDQLVEQDGANGTLVFYHDDKGDTGVIVYNGTSYTLRKNAQGDVTAILDIANNIVAKYTYDAWGKVLSVTDANGNAITDPNHIANINPIRYRGYYYDTETGLYYLNSRYYDPETCRMLNGDSVNTTIEQNDSLFSTNLFAYCSNNPVNYADDDGQWGLPTWAKIAIGVAGIAAAVAVTVATGGAATPALFAAVKIVAISVASSAAIGGVVGYATGGKAGLKKGLISGAIDGFMWGGIGAGVSAAAKAYKR